MYTCPYCKIRVGGSSKKCPLCQSRLFGDGEEPHFPTVENLKIRSFLYRLQMFIVLSAVIIGLGLDFLLHLEIPAFPGLHWSLILAMWLLVSEFLIVRNFRPGTGSARKVTLMAWVILGMLLISGAVPCILRFFMDDQMPILWTICVIIAVILLTGAVVIQGPVRGGRTAEEI